MLELDIIKKQCRIDEDDSDEDELLTGYSEAAAKHIEMYTRRTLYATTDASGYRDDPDALLLTDNVQQAMLLLIGHWYANRESVVVGFTTASLPLAFESLLQPYRIYGIS